MWSRFTTSSSYKGKVKMKQPCKTLNLNDEYLCAVRTKSFADFFVKVQVNLANHPSLPSLSSSSKDSHLLEPGQETITSLLHNSPSNHGLKSLLSNYFHISAEASDYCSNLLKTLIHLQADHTDLRRHYAGLNRHDFACIHEKHSSVLHQLRSSRKRVARKMKTIRAVNITSRVFVTAACGVAAAAAMVVAAHTLTAIVVGPMMVACVPLKPLKKKLKGLGFVMKYRVLRRVAEQLDVAAKGAYILNRDFDTMGRLVGRLEDEIEHKKAMMEMCVERRKERSFCQQVMKELEKYELGFIKQVEELEEHVYLCLATINRARALVAKEISSGNKS